jgi:ATP-dependent DNA ligase
MDLLKPMLADSPAQPVKKLDDDAWWGQRKFDGVRLLVHVSDGKIIPVNRNGVVVSIPYTLKQPFSEFTSGNFIFDGEFCQDDVMYIFDMPVAGKAVSPSMPYEHRLGVLEQFHARWDPGSKVQLVSTARTTAEKHALHQYLQDNDAEGMILKRKTGAYRSGVRSSDTVKFKFWQSTDVFIDETCVDGKSNAVMHMFDENGKEINVGTVSTLGKWGALVDVGSVLEVRYLYCVDRNRPHLVQPNILRVRTDKTADQCTSHDLHFTNKTLT